MKPNKLTLNERVKELEIQMRLVYKLLSMKLKK